jgi:hypothetical protein
MTAMRRIVLWMLVFALAAPVWAKDESVDGLKARLASARPEDRPGLCIRIAQDQLLAADGFYSEGKIEQARASVADVVTYSEKARDAAVDTRKHLKNVEIAIRRISEKLNDIKRTLAFEEQPPVEEAVRHLEDVRTALLKEMFKKEKK